MGADVGPFLRNIQASYLRSRGYSIGYNFGIAQDGSEWEIRGDSLNNAANAGKKVVDNFNHVSQSIFVMVDEQDEATPAAVATINARIATHPDWEVMVHSDVDYTSCAGIGLTAQVRSGVIGHQAAPVPVPPPVAPPVPPVVIQGDTMLYIAVPKFAEANANTAWLAVFQSGEVRRAMNTDVVYAQSNGIPLLDLDSYDQWKDISQKFDV